MLLFLMDLFIYDILPKKKYWYFQSNDITSLPSIEIQRIEPSPLDITAVEYSSDLSIFTIGYNWTSSNDTFHVKVSTSKITFEYDVENLQCGEVQISKDLSPPPDPSLPTIPQNDNTEGGVPAWQYILLVVGILVILLSIGCFVKQCCFNKDEEKSDPNKAFDDWRDT